MSEEESGRRSKRGMGSAVKAKNASILFGGSGQSKRANRFDLRPGWVPPTSPFQGALPVCVSLQGRTLSSPGSRSLSTRQRDNDGTISAYRPAGTQPFGNPAVERLV